MSIEILLEEFIYIAGQVQRVCGTGVPACRFDVIFTSCCKEQNKFTLKCCQKSIYI